MATATTDQAMVWTCRLALAVAESDQAEIEAVVTEAMAVPAGPSMLLTTMAGTLASLMGEMTGPNWKKAMQQTLASVQGH